MEGFKVRKRLKPVPWVTFEEGHGMWMISSPIVCPFIPDCANARLRNRAMLLHSHNRFTLRKTPCHRAIDSHWIRGSQDMRLLSFSQPYQAVRSRTNGIQPHARLPQGAVFVETTRLRLACEGRQVCHAIARNEVELRRSAAALSAQKLRVLC